MPMPKASMLRETAKIKTAAKPHVTNSIPPILWGTDKNGVCSRARPHIYKSGRQAPNPKDKNSRLILRFPLCEGIIGRSLFRLWGRFLSFCLKRPVGTGKPAAGRGCGI